MEIAEKRKKMMSSMGRLRARKPMLVSNEKIPDHEFFLLMAIDHLQRKHPEEVKISDISDHMRISVPGVSQGLRSLENRNLILRNPALHDRRIVYIALSEKGKNLLAEIYRNSNVRIEHILTEFGDERTEQLLHLIDDLCDILDRMDKREETSHEKTC